MPGMAPARFALRAALLMLAGLCVAQAEFYASNETGMAFEEVPAFRSRDFDFNLEIRRTGDIQANSVWKRDGTEYRRWEYRLNSAGRVAGLKFYEDGRLKEEESYRADGRIESSSVYGESGLERKTAYEYSGKRLVKATTADASGSRLYVDSYKYALNGSLREMKRSFADGTAKGAGQDLSGGRVADTWYSSGTSTTMDRYSASGELSASEKWDKANLLRSDAVSFRENGKDKDRQVVTDSERGIEIERLFDDKGRLSVEIARKDEAVQSRTEYAYDDLGRLSEKRFSGKGKRVILRLSYNPDGSKAGEEESENGEIVRRLIYQKDGSYWEEILHDGQVAVRARWSDGWKREEEILRDGKVIRRRDFK